MLKQLLLTIAVLLVVISFQTTTCETESVSKTIIVKARLNSDNLVKLLGIGTSDLNAIYTRYFVNETLKITYTFIRVNNSYIEITECRVVVLYKPWYNPNYIIVIGELDNNYVFVKAIEQVVDKNYPIGVVDEVLLNELGLLTYLNIIVSINDYVEFTYINDTVVHNRFLIGKTIYSRPAWEQYLDTIHKYRVRVPYEPVVSTPEPYAPETPVETRDQYSPTPVSPVETAGEKTVSINYEPLIYAFIVALVLTILVYVAYKIL